ncbi:hypothetical protein ABZ330_06475 [Streptomyces sp. NPDC006172]|uniref:hypothetical protein n=1 Tax=Streptomyces sp. NPDC006172 TaxID=3154470 RepID=UPI00340BB719
MATGGVLSPTAARLLALAITAGVSAAGCGSPSGSTPAGGTPSETAPPPEALCARVVAHWSRAVLDSDTYGDYQSMGLSNGQYDILRTVVDAARATRERQGARAADALIDRQARAGCVRWYRSGGPGEGPWS